MFTNVVKLDVENDNLVSTLSNVAHVNVEIHNVDSTLYISTLKYATLFQRWFDVVPRCDIASTKRQRWNNIEIFAGDNHYYTAFKADRSLHQLKCMSFGITYGVTCFLRSMDNAMSEEEPGDTFALWPVLRYVA